MWREFFCVVSLAPLEIKENEENDNNEQNDSGSVLFSRHFVLISDHATQTMFAAYLNFIDIELKFVRASTNCADDHLVQLERVDHLWDLLLKNGLRELFVEEPAVTKDDVDFEIVNYFAWRYRRDGKRTFSECWRNIQSTWRNYKLMGLNKHFEEPHEDNDR